MSTEEFGGLTLAMFEALLKRRQEEQKHGFLLAGVVAAAVYNSNPYREKGAKSVSPLDFVPDYRARESGNGKRGTGRVQTLDEQIATLTVIMGCGPGKQ